MPFKIAVAGKGGTGKTTLSAMITKYLLDAGKAPVLAVDADPNANLNEALGVHYDRTVVETVDEVMGASGSIPAGVSKGQFVEYHVHDALVESKGFDLLVMGHTEGPGCYCYANDLLKGFLEKLSSGYSYLVMDNEAGMEHLSRRTTRDINVLLIVANPSATAVRSAGRIHEVVSKLKLSIDRSYLVLNRLNPVADRSGNGSPLDALVSSLSDSGLPLLTEVPYDEQVAVNSMEAKGVLDLPGDSASRLAIAKMMEQLGV
jgi:CO dehydrogenase maturation factor